MGLAEGATPRPFIKFYPIRRRLRRGRNGHSLTITYSAVDLDFEGTVLARLKREGYKRINIIEFKRVGPVKKDYTRIVVLK